MASVDSNTVATTTANVVELDGIWELGEHAQDNPPAQHTVSTIPAAPHAVMQPRPEKEDVRAAVQSKPKKSKPTAAAFFDDMPAHWSSSTNVHQRQRLANRAQKHAVAPKRAKMETLPMNFPSTEPQSDKLRFAPSWLAPTASTSSSTRGAPQPMEEIVNITPDAPSRQLRAHLEDRDDADLHYDHSHALLTSHPAPRFALTPSKNKPTRVGSLRWRLQKISREAEAVDTYFSMLGNRDEFSLPANGLQDPRNRSKWQVVAEVKEDKTRGGGFFAARLAIEEILGDVTGSATADLGGGGGAAAASGGGRGVCEDIADEPADVDPAPWHRTPRVGDSAVVVFRDQPTIDSLKESLPGQHIKLFDPIWLPYSSQEVGKRCKAIEKWVAAEPTDGLLLCTVCWELL